MGEEKDRTLLDWLGLRHAPDWSKARWLGGLFGALLTGAVILLLLMAIAAAGAMLAHALFDIGLGTERGGFGTGAVIVALLGAPFVIWRAVVAQKQADVAEQGHITDRINTAVQGLGAEKEVKRDGVESTVPNLEVRIGAIYALERIAQDSDRDHVQIMEILCAYIRQNAPAPQTDDWPELEMKESEEDGPLEADWRDRLQAFRESQEEARAKLKPREDIQTALTVIGRRSAKQRRLEAGRGAEAAFPFDTPCPDYAGPEDGQDPAALETYQEKLAASKAALRDYDGYRLDLRNSDLRGADLSRLTLAGARLGRTHLQGAVLVEARLQGADLRGARLQGADLLGARLQGADLRGARFDPETDLAAATLRGAAARSVDFTDIPQIADHIHEMFGDGSVTLPGGHGPEHEGWPAHWPRQELGFPEFHKEWRKWQADPNGYTPPERTAG